MTPPHEQEQNHQTPQDGLETDVSKIVSLHLTLFTFIKEKG